MSSIIHDPLKCGACGGDTFRLKHVADQRAYVRVGGHGSGGFPGSIHVICVKCKALTLLTTNPAQLCTDNESTLCGGWTR